MRWGLSFPVCAALCCAALSRLVVLQCVCGVLCFVLCKLELSRLDLFRLAFAFFVELSCVVLSCIPLCSGVLT